MALIDEEKLQGNVMRLLAIAEKNRACCTSVVAVYAANSSGTGGVVFVQFIKDGTFKVYQDLTKAPLTPAEYGSLTL